MDDGSSRSGQGRAPAVSSIVGWATHAGSGSGAPGPARGGAAARAPARSGQGRRERRLRRTAAGRRAARGVRGRRARGERGAGQGQPCRHAARRPGAGDRAGGGDPRRRRRHDLGEAVAGQRRAGAAGGAEPAPSAPACPSWRPAGVRLGQRPGEGWRSLHEVFQATRLAAPCLLLLDQLDAVGDGPGTRQGSFSRGVVEQLVAELQLIRDEHDEVTVVAASENPWDVDPLLRERMGRRLLVLPPDREAREAILWDAIGDYPVAELNVPSLAGRTEGFSATDLIILADSAVEIATERAISSGRDRPVSMNDFDRALVGIQPSPPAWLALARDFVLYAGHGGVYDDLLAYLRVRT